tara:strand:+ start:97 stop:1230 length:1134 start_codon:yes stop_codon:yes gene_type:complete
MDNNNFIPVFKPSLSMKNKYDVFRSILKSEISGTSPVVKEFEDDLSTTFDRKYVVTVSNGSVALELAIKSLDLKENDEVIIPSFTIVSCLSAVVRSGATPVFCDVDPFTWCMNLDEIKSKVTKNTKAILVVHTYGLPAEVSEIEKYCLNNKITLIEDAAEAHGITVDERPCGSFGKISTMSFYANKHITAGEGGAVLTNNEDIFNELIQMRNLDFRQDRRFRHDNLYWNYRMGGLQAALGKSQIKDLEKTIKFKIEQGNYYQDLLSDSSDLIQLPLKNNGEHLNHYWVFGILLKKENIKNKVVNELNDLNIQTRPFFWPLHKQDALPEKFKNSSLKLIVSEKLGNDGFYIPMGDHVTKDMQKFISKSILDIVNRLSD